MAYMKKNHPFKDLCRNIEINVKELSTSKILSHKFLLGKMPVNFLLIKPEIFCEKKDKLLKQLGVSHKRNLERGKESVTKQGNLLF